MDEVVLMKEAEDAMNARLDHMTSEFASVRTGKASPALVDGVDIHIPSYGSNMKLNQLAMVTTPDARMILVQPFDPSTTADIERGLREANLGINPTVDGNFIRLPIPEMSEERRVEMVKRVKTIGEESKVKIRGSRKDAIDQVKKAQKDSEITEDDLHRLEKEIQNLTDKFTKGIDDKVDAKEKEIMTV